MKIRENLVSNSSSTSFIIAFKKSVPCPHCGRKDPDIVKLLEAAETYGNSDRDMVEAVGLKDVKNHIAQCWESEAKEDVEKILKNIKKYEEQKDWSFAAIRISYGNDAIRTILNNGIASGSIVELYDSDE